MTQPTLFDATPSTVTLSPVAIELDRRRSNYEAVVARLMRGPATNHELVALAGYRYSARLYELKQHGGDYTRERIDATTFRYTMTRSPR